MILKINEYLVTPSPMWEDISKLYEGLSWETAICIRYALAQSFEERLLKEPLERIIEAIELCSRDKWYEGVLICEREIARRGLHVEDNEGRFTL